MTATLSPLGPPYLGGPYRDFTHTYGQPFNAVDLLFYADSSQTIIFGVDVKANLVDQVSVIQVPSDWSNSQTLAECEIFLPSGATKFNSDPPWTDYHSSLGEVVIQTASGNCVMSFALS